MSEKNISLHDRVKRQVSLVCNDLGLQAKEEFRGADWRADVFVDNKGVKYAFEVQIAQQSLKKTIERQDKYLRDGIIGCWLFERERKRKVEELETLPLFQVIEDNGQFLISLKGRKTLPLDVFINDFLNGQIKFCRTRKALPIIDINFLKMDCWKCHAPNHIYYLAPLHSSCNTIVDHQEELWVSEKLAFNPEIIKKITEYTQTENGQHICLSSIKERYSGTMDMSYMSFGCRKCDSIFGDFYVHEAIIDTWYGDGIADQITIKLDSDIDIHEDIPHWCHPGKHEFCE